MSSTCSALCADGVLMLLKRRRIALISDCNMTMTCRSSVVFASLAREDIEGGGIRCDSESGCARESEGHSSPGASVDPAFVFVVSVFAKFGDRWPVALTVDGESLSADATFRDL